MITKKQLEEQMNTIAACIKMPISYICECRENLSYKPSSMECRKCIAAKRIMRSLLNDDLVKALTKNDLKKVINILSEVN